MADDQPGAASAAPPEPASAAQAPDLEARVWAAIQAWRAAHIAGGPIARVTACWNHLEATLGHLAQAILKEI